MKGLLTTRQYVVIVPLNVLHHHAQKASKIKDACCWQMVRILLILLLLRRYTKRSQCNNRVRH